MAGFVVAFGWTPANYWAITLAERNAIAKAHDKARKKH